ncbi:ANTAR domain-containing response regulator [Neotabrizicola sp. sgz301269]|uniref:ANTAR domain-containing response regulator n=1 Tax=Neotabrizicola sp. sgz301269 TaxID=3276282 RepID=UPI00376FC27A
MRNTRSIRILLVQPPGHDRETLQRHLQRVGFLTEASWPPSPPLYELADVVCVAFRSVAEGNVKLRWNRDDPPAALLALLDFENPAIVREAIKLNAHAVLGLPVRSFGVVANIFVAQNNFKLHKDLSNLAKRLKTRVESEKTLNKAKQVLMASHGMTEQDAHKALRTYAMNRRVNMLEIAKVIAGADDVFNALEKLDKIETSAAETSPEAKS